MTTLSANVEEVRRAVAMLCDPGEVYELRVLNTRRGTISGYFDQPEALVKAVVEADRLSPPGIYLTLNPVRRDLLARAANTTRDFCKHTTSDADVVRRRWLPLDFDPIRPADISSSDAEHEAALERAARVSEWLKRTVGFGDPVCADSGNGAHLLYRIDLPNDDNSRDLIKRALEAVSIKFDDDKVAVDKKCFNAARIWKIYGTVARKGSHLDDRPYRQATTRGAL